MSRTKDMTAGSPARLIIYFAVPLILANLGQQLYMIVDAIIVGKGVGVEALASVGAADWAYWLVLWIIQGLAQGFAIPVSQSFGGNDRIQIRKTAAQIVQLCLVIGIVLTVVFLIAANPLLHILQTPEDVFAGTSAYLITMYGGILVVMAYNIASSVLRALGDGKTPLIAIAVAAVTNILLDLLFVLIFHWGIVGAAVATVAAQFLAFVYCLLVLRKIEIMQIRKEDWKPDVKLISRLCRLGFPLALQMVMIAIGGMVLQSAINRQGFLFIAGFTATNKIYGLLESSAISLGYALTTYVAQNYGAGFFDRIRKGMKISLIISIILSVCISVIMILGGSFLLRLFIDSSSPDAPGVLQISRHYLFILSCFLSTLYLLHIFRNVLQGLGDTLAPFLSGVMEFAARVTVALVFVRFWDREALFFAEPGAWILAMLLLIVMCVRRVNTLPNEKKHAKAVCLWQQKKSI